MAGIGDPPAKRHFIVSEDDLRDFVAGTFQKRSEWLEERKLGAGVELDPEAEKALTPEVRKIAVDTLYAAREANKVMDQAAILVAAAVLTEAKLPDLSIELSGGTENPPYPAELLDEMATALALAAHWIASDFSGTEDRQRAASVLDAYSQEVGRENVPAPVDAAIARLA